MIPARQSASSAAPPGWLSVSDAAALLGCTPRNVTQLCRDEWLPRGLSRLDGNRWLVSRSADQRLRVSVDLARRDREQVAALSAAGVKPKYLDLAESRRDVVVGLEPWARNHRGLPAREQRRLYVGHLQAIGMVGPSSDITRLSATQLYVWESAYSADGLRGLVPRAADRSDQSRDRKGVVGSIATPGGMAAALGGHACGVGASALDYICTLLDCGNRISLAAAITIARGEALKHGADPTWSIGSYSAVRLAVAERRPRILRVLADQGERRAIADCVPKFQRQYEDIASGDEYVGDERTLDVWCRVRDSRGWRSVRPKATATLDIRSRMIVGLILAPYASSRTILGSLKLAIATHGKPRILRTDWGEDYKSITRHGLGHTSPSSHDSHSSVPELQSILTELGIEIIRTIAPYTPWAKPIESFFRGMKDHLDKLFGGFWGGCPSERHQDRARYLRENLEKLPTIDDLREAVIAWLDTVYHRTPHSAPDMFGKCPLEAMSAFRAEPARMESAEVLDHLFREFVGPLTIRRDGIRHNARWYGNGDMRLVPMQGRKILLGIQPDDQGTALVCQLDRKPLFMVECLSLAGRTREETAEMHRQRHRVMRPYRDQAKAARKFLLDTTPRALLANAAAGVAAQHPLSSQSASSAKSAAPPSLTIVRPALEQALATAGRAPSEAASKAVRTGTDNDPITLADLIDDDCDAASGGCGAGFQPVRVAPADGECAPLTFDDLCGEF